MNNFTKRNKTKKFILVIVLLLLLEFVTPTYKAYAFDWNKVAFNVEVIVLDLVHQAEYGILKLMNNLFVKKEFRADDTNKTIRLSPETIITGKFILFDADIFKDPETQRDAYDFEDPGGESRYFVDGKVELRKTVAGWYYALRNFAAVCLLSVLVYVAIRMIISTVSQDKAKYKAMFKDWLVAICLLVVMHFLMVTILNVTSMIVNAIGSSAGDAMLLEELTGKINAVVDGPEYNKNTNPHPHGIYEATGEDISYADAWGYVLCYLGIIGYTLIFLIKYLKREFTVIFLILLGPISCITYPIDKISDGKAQAFNKWLTEFIYQVLIQPFHLLLYIVLIGTAATLASKNIIYCIVCFAVMIPAEQFVKSMFGFKDSLGSPLSNMMKMDMFRNAFSGNGGGSRGGSRDSGNDKKVPDLEKEDKQQPRLKNGNATDEKESERDGGNGPRIGGGPGGNGQDNNDEETAGPQAIGPAGGTDDNSEETAGPQAIEAGEDDSPEIEGDENPNAVKEGEATSENENQDSIDTTDNEEEQESDESLDTGENPETADNGGSADASNGGGNGSEATENTPKHYFRNALKEAGGALRKNHRDKLMAKYGTAGGNVTDLFRKGKRLTALKGMAKLAQRRAWRAIKKGGKYAGRKIRGAATWGIKSTAKFAGAAALGIVGSMFGKGNQGAAMGMRIGGAVGNIAEKGINYATDKVTSKAGELTGIAHNKFWKEMKKDPKFANVPLGRDKDKEKYVTDVNNIARAERNFKSREKSNPSPTELSEELDKMQEFSELGVNDADMSRTIGEYNDFKDDYVSKMEDSEIESYTAGVKDLEGKDINEKRDYVAKALTMEAHRLHRTHGSEYFEDQEKIQTMSDTLGKRIGTNNQVLINKIINSASHIKNGKDDGDLPPSLLPPETSGMPIQKRLPPKATMKDYTKRKPLTEQEQSRYNNMLTRFEGMGYSDDQIKGIISGSTTLGEIGKSMDFLADPTQRSDAMKSLGINKETNNNKSQINDEMYQRLLLDKSEMKGIDDLRKDEKALGEEFTDDARFVANNFTQEQLNNPDTRKSLIDQYTDLYKNKGMGDKEAERKATGVANLATKYRNSVPNGNIRVPLPVNRKNLTGGAQIQRLAGGRPAQRQEQQAPQRQNITLEPQLQGEVEEFVNGLKAEGYTPEQIGEVAQLVTSKGDFEQLKIAKRAVGPNAPKEQLINETQKRIDLSRAGIEDSEIDYLRKRENATPNIVNTARALSNASTWDQLHDIGIRKQLTDRIAKQLESEGVTDPKEQQRQAGEIVALATRYKGRPENEIINIPISNNFETPRIPSSIGTKEVQAGSAEEIVLNMQLAERGFDRISAQSDEARVFLTDPNRRAEIKANLGGENVTDEQVDNGLLDTFETAYVLGSTYAPSDFESQSGSGLNAAIGEALKNEYRGGDIGMAETLARQISRRMATMSNPEKVNDGMRRVITEMAQRIAPEYLPGLAELDSDLFSYILKETYGIDTGDVELSTEKIGVMVDASRAFSNMREINLLGATTSRSRKRITECALDLYLAGYSEAERVEFARIAGQLGGDEETKIDNYITFSRVGIDKRNSDLNVSSISGGFSRRTASSVDTYIDERKLTEMIRSQASSMSSDDAAKLGRSVAEMMNSQRPQPMIDSSKLRETMEIAEKCSLEEIEKLAQLDGKAFGEELSRFGISGATEEHTTEEIAMTLDAAKVAKTVEQAKIPNIEGIKNAGHRKTVIDYAIKLKVEGGYSESLAGKLLEVAQQMGGPEETIVENFKTMVEGTTSGKLSIDVGKISQGSSKQATHTTTQSYSTADLQKELERMTSGNKEMAKELEAKLKDITERSSSSNSTSQKSSYAEAQRQAESAKRKIEAELAKSQQEAVGSVVDAVNKSRSGGGSTRETHTTETTTMKVSAPEVKMPSSFGQLPPKKEKIVRDHIEKLTIEYGFSQKEIDALAQLASSQNGGIVQEVIDRFSTTAEAVASPAGIDAINRIVGENASSGAKRREAYTQFQQLMANGDGDIERVVSERQQKLKINPTSSSTSERRQRETTSGPVTNGRERKTNQSSLSGNAPRRRSSLGGNTPRPSTQLDGRSSNPGSPQSGTSRPGRPGRKRKK